MDHQSNAPTLLSRLSGVPLSDYPRIWCELNARGWPDELGQRPEAAHKEIWALMDYIEGAVGEKAILRQHNKGRGMTDQQFDDWWDSFEGRPNRQNNFWGIGEKKCPEGCKECSEEGSSDGETPLKDAVLFALGLVSGFLLALFAAVV